MIRTPPQSCAESDIIANPNSLQALETNASTSLQLNSAILPPISTANSSLPISPPLPKNSAPKSQKAPSVRSRTSSRRRISLELKRLKEEKSLEEKYLAKKYELLQEMASDEDEDIDDEELSTTSKNRLENWLTFQDGQQTLISKPQVTNNSILNNTWFGPKVPEGQINSSREVNNQNAPHISPVAANISHQHQPFRSARVEGIQEEPTYKLSQRQIAARQSTPKELPKFNGNPEDWALFISAFQSSTRICGFSDEENLGRLRASLKGKALDAVRSRLSHPGQVSKIISTLQMMFGRPEIIISTLLQKIRREPPLKVDKLDSLVKYSLDVENVCSTMEITGCSSHLNNPILLQELVERLPPTIRLNWSIYKQTLSTIDISQFSMWLFEVGRAANDVNFCNPVGHERNLNQIQKQKQERSYVNIHDDLHANKCEICDKNCPSVAKCRTFIHYTVQQRWAKLKEKQLCRTCLRRHSNKCTSNQLCGEHGCSFRHHKLLHKNKNAIPTDTVQSIGAAAAVSKTDNLPSTSSSPIFHTQSRESAILFRVLPVTLYGNNTQIETFAFLDDGSSTSLIEESLANSLGVKGEHLPLKLKWTSDTVREEINSKKITLEISGNNKENKFTMCGVRTVEHLDLPEQTIDASELVKRYKHLKDIPFTSYLRAKPGILIGLQHWNLGIPLRTREGSAAEPVATKTRLGWTVFGPYNPRAGKVLSVGYQLYVCECNRSDDELLSDSLKEFFAIENMGTKKVKLLSPDEERAKQILDAHSQMIGNAFQVPLLWKHINVKLPESKTNALRRLQSLEKRFVREPHLRDLISNLIQDYLEKGYARKISPTSIVTERTWYLPIFPVFNAHKPNKIRIVWDAASKVNGVSLNSVLLTGPDIMSPLLGILFRFRERKVGLCADIKEMFHQVKIRKEDHDAQRFLWRNAISNEVEVYVLQVMSFGATCSPFCAQYIKNRNAERFLLQFPDAVDAIINNHYVDDFIASFDSKEEATKIANEVMYVHSQGGFEIRNFKSNSQSVMNQLEFRSKESVVPMSNTEKVLGLWWSTTSDEFFFTFNRERINPRIIDGNQLPTKREVLRFLMQIYDPLGLIANILINLKILLQLIWKSGISWDDQIQQDHNIIWRKWVQLIPSISQIKIPRTYFTNFSIVEADKVELHIFCDASADAFASVAFIRISCGEKIQCCLVAAKTKVAPLRHISIPRMELEAAVMGCRLASSIIENHSIKFTRQIYWTDSKTVIYWIRSPNRKLQQFVSLRIGEILSTTEATSWKWVPSKLNIADEATKTRMNFDFSSQSRWYKGPDFLWKPEQYWPKCELDLTSLDDDIVEQFCHTAVNQTCVIDHFKFSKWRKLLNTMARVFQFIDLCKRVNIQLRYVDFLKKSEHYLLREAQKDAFEEEIRQFKEAIGNEGVVLSKTSQLYKLSPYVDENGLLRISGRIDALSELDVDTRRPIVLPKGHHITYLILDHYHRKFQHQYNETIVNEVRQRFFIPCLRVMVKKIQRGCQLCRNQRSVPSIPIMGELPPARLKVFTRPFTYVGMDYFGPLPVVVGRRREKRWGVIFTCLTVRAIHVEVAYSLTTSSCILALQRFIARRGMPKHIYTDNGTNFRGASRELKAAIGNIDGKKLVENIGEGRLKWSFIPPAAPHMGGCWERLVRSVKQTLTQISTTRTPCDELLQSMMAEIENIINSRPLTYVPLSSENEEALTPNHFLLGSSSGAKPLGEFSESGVVLKQNWMVAEQFSNSFWRRWIREYLPNLTRRTKWFHPTKPISENDIVIVVDEKSPRNCWLKGRVVEVNPGRDGKIRSAAIQTKFGIYVRPVAKLAVLDVASSNHIGKQDHRSSLPRGSVKKPGSTGPIAQ